MTTPKDIIAAALRGHADDAGEVAKIIIHSLAREGYAIARRSALPVDVHKDPEDQKRRLVEEMEATTAARTEDFIRELQRGRSGLKK